MLSVIQLTLRWIIRHFLWFVAIVAILVTGNLIRKDLKEFALLTEGRSILSSGKPGFESHANKIERETVTRITELEKQATGKINARIASLEKEISEKTLEQQKHGTGVSLLYKSPIEKAIFERARRDLEIKALEHERNYLKELVLRADATLRRQAALERLEQLRQAHIAAYSKLQQVQNDLTRAEANRDWKAKIQIWSRETKDYQDLKKTRDDWLAVNGHAHQNYQLQKNLAESSTIPALRKFTYPQDLTNQIGNSLDKRIEELNNQLSRNWITVITGPAKEVLPAALLILLSIIFLPIAIKATLYFIVAPWAARRPPIRLLPEALGSIASPVVQGTEGRDGGKISAVSLPVVLNEHEDLVVQPDYLQSTPVQARKETKWLLNGRFPFASLASGMFLLTKVSTTDSEPIVISPTKDPLLEVGIVKLADGAAFVCQPRSLVGVIQDVDNPIRITRHWRLSSLQGWLTLQLRFLVFHGSGQLILKGCRGVRIEAARKGRIINQAATLGFSANLDYGNARCETFMSYWSGKEELFNDLFSGETGMYVYEEMPDLKRPVGVGRHLEGLSDALLKVFGI